jgi:hypothetical protein
MLCRVRVEGWNRSPDDFGARFDLTAAAQQPRITQSPDLLWASVRRAVEFAVGQRHQLARRWERLNQQQVCGASPVVPRVGGDSATSGLNLPRRPAPQP